MSRCQGNTPVSTKVDTSMVEFLIDEADRTGVTRAELIRRILDDYRDAQLGEWACPDCGEPLVLEP